MRLRNACTLGLLIAGSLIGQDPAREMAARIRAGGWFETSQYRRDDDGVLQFRMFADTGHPNMARWVPFTSLGDPPWVIDTLGPLGVLAMLCHGNADLLAMTDFDFHFGALGVPIGDIDLRQRLLIEKANFDGPHGRAELLDRMLIIDHLVARGVRGAIGELSAIAKDATLPAMLRDRARAAVATLQGKPTPVRSRLDPTKVQLPPSFDACVVIDHARLPDLRWLTPLARRVGALLIASQIEAAGGGINDAMCNGAQRICDAVAATPFFVVHKCGNARLDHSLIAIAATKNAAAPVAVLWNAAGEFESKLWSEPNQLGLLCGDMTGTASTLLVSSDGSKGVEQPATANALLIDRGAAVFATIPGNSAMWSLLGSLDLPPATGAELQITFGDPTVLAIRVGAADAATAARWLARGRELLEAIQPWLAAFPPEVTESLEVRQLLRSVLATKFLADENTAVATIHVGKFTTQNVRDLIQGFAAAKRY